MLIRNINSLCKKTPNTALFSFLKQSFTISKLLGFKNFESLVFDAFLSKTQKQEAFLQTLNTKNMDLHNELEEMKLYRSFWGVLNSGFSLFMRPCSYLVSLLVVLLVFTSCVRDLTGLNVNPDQPLETDPNYLFSYVLQQGAGNYNSDVTLEQWGVMNWVMYLASREGVEPGREYPMPSGKDDFWREQYTNTLSNAQVIIDMADEDAQMVNMQAASEIWQVYVFSLLTDLWGQVPYTHALQGISDNTLSPRYDSQKVIYTQMIEKLQNAVEKFDVEAPFFNSESDIIYQGDINAWQAFGNSLMLRLATRVNKVDYALYTSVLTYLQDKQLISSVTESAIFPFNAVRKNHLWETMYRNESIVQNNPSKFFVDILVETDDPRKKVFFEQSPLSFLPFIPKYKGIPNLLPNTAEQWADYNLNADLGVAGEWGDISKIGHWFLNDNTPGVIMNYSEVCFLLAEASLNGLWSESADELMDRGVRANMDFFNLYSDGDNFISEPEINTYLVNLPEAGLEQVITQKWISFAFEQGYEAYAEYRRTGFPVLTDFFDNPIEYSLFPLRLPYPNSEYTLNQDAYNEAVADQGPDSEFTKMWWIP